MKYPVLFLFAVLFAATTAHAQTTVPKTAVEIAREQAQAIVVIEQLDDSGNVIGQGSGFIVTPAGAIVTCLHVIQGASSLLVRLPGGDAYKTTDVVDFDEFKDIAIIRIRGFKMPVVALGDSDYVQQGENVIVISSPQGLVGSVTTGVISGMRRQDTHRLFQISAPISKGSSGGALFDVNGMVIGIATSVFEAGQNINFAVPINYARGMISDQPTTAVAKLPQLPSSTEVAAQAQASVTPPPTNPLATARLSNAATARLGRSAQEPMFVRPDEAMNFFYRLVDGIGRYGVTEVADLTRTAAIAKAGETATHIEYSLPYLSFYIGLKMSLRKSDRVLDRVEMLVDWTVEDLKRSLGDKFKKKVIDGKQALEMKEKRDDKQTLHIVAFPDTGGKIRAVQFTK
ncbi:MAG: S1C family serine protease [Blastocatellia bacterium]